MHISDKADIPREELAPGVDRWSLLDGDKGAESLSVGDVTLAAGASVPTHMHPTEEILGPPGVKHGFVNRSAVFQYATVIQPE